MYEVLLTVGAHAQQGLRYEALEDGRRWVLSVLAGTKLWSSISQPHDVIVDLSQVTSTEAKYFETGVLATLVWRSHTHEREARGSGVMLDCDLYQRNA